MNENNEPKTKDTSLKISQSANENLSKSQETFNNLTEQLALLEKDLAGLTNKLDLLSDEYAKKLYPVKLENARWQIAIAKQISAATYIPKYGKKNIEKARMVIQDLLSQAFEFITPDEDLQHLYNTWSDYTFKEEKEAVHASQREMMEEYVQRTYGIKVDLSAYDDTPGGQARMHAYLREKIEEIEDKKGGSENEPSDAKPKSKKKLAEEQQKRDVEALELKSLRSLYIALAKALHPDTEMDVKKKSYKEELMKKVVVAYENKDLSELLKLEMQWIHKDVDHLDRLSEDKLKLYISVLKKKLEELRQQRFHVPHHPKYQGISGLVDYSEKKARKMLRDEINYQVNRGGELTKFHQYLSEDDSKNTAIQLVDMYAESLDSHLDW